MTSFIKRIFRALAQENENSFFTKDFLQGRGFEIGEFTYGRPKVLHWGEKSTLKVGKFCSIADNVTIFLGGNHRTDWVTTYPFNVITDHFPEGKTVSGHPATKGSVIIGNDVWIGQGVMILSGVTIGDGAVIAAGSVVTTSVKDYEVVGGNPSRHLKYRFSAEVREKLMEIKWWNWSNEKIANKIKDLCQGDVEQFIRSVNP